MRALRSLIKTPGFTITALITLALGIGVNTSMFSLLNALLLRTLPYPEGDRLVRVYRTSPQSQSWPHSPANFFDYQAQNQVFEKMATHRGASYALTAPGQPAGRMRGMEVSAEFFAVLGVQPILGRVFTAEEDRPNRNRVVVLSHPAWVNRFNGDPSIIGRDVRMNDEPVTVIGVMPPGFEDRQAWGRIESWRPIAFSDELRQVRNSNFLGIVARLKPGVSFGQAQAAMHTLAARHAKAHVENTSDGLRLVPLARTGMDETGQRMTWFMVGLAAFVLLIACANLANLQFARTAGRARDLAIRTALGASRLRLIRELLLESVLLGLAGGGLGLLVATWCNELLSRRIIVANQPGLALPVDLRLLGFALAVSIGTGIAFGLLPAWLASRTDVNDALKQGTRGSRAGRKQRRARHALIISEVALALVLLSGAGFFLRGLQRFLQRDPGWRLEGVLTGYIALNGNKYSNDDKRRAFQEQLQARLAALPGVERATTAGGLPTWGFSGSSNMMIEGRPRPAPGQAPLFDRVNVSPSYFETLGIPLLAGRTFNADDRPGKPAVVIVNETLARTLWPGESALGKRIGGLGENPNWEEIVGIVKDTRPAGHLRSPDTMFQLYRPIAQSTSGYVVFALRAPIKPEVLANDVRRVVAAIDPDQPVHDIATVRQEIEQGLANIALVGWILAGFALLGVALAAVGIYGVIAGSVAQRTNEIGVRMALGAQVRDIVALVLGQGMRLAFTGAAIGLVGALAVGWLLRASVPQLPGPELLAAAGVTALLIGVAALACWLPARRATKVDPMAALRAE